VKTVKFKVSDFNNEVMEKIILQKLKGLDGILDVSTDLKSQEVTLSVSDPAVCEGVYCAIEDLGYKVHRP